MEAKIDGMDDLGMMRISLVDYPAVESDFVAFAKNARPTMYSVQDEEKRLVRGVVMRADFPIYRVDWFNGEYYVVYRAATIREMAEKYLAEGRQNNVNLMHENGSSVHGVNMVQMFIKDAARGITPEGFDDIEDGSLFAEFHVTNDEVWQEIKAGTFKGFSLEGYFVTTPIEDDDAGFSFRGLFKTLFNNDMSKLQKIKALLAELLADDKKVEMASATTDKGVLSWDGEEAVKEGDAVYILDEAGNRTPAEDGEYTTEDSIIVVADGKVAEIKEKGSSEEEEDPTRVEQEEEEEKETPEGGDLEKRIAELEDAVAQILDLLKKNGEAMSTLSDKVETLSKQPKAEPAQEVFKQHTTPKDTGNKALDTLKKNLGL